MASMRHPCKFQRVSHLGSVTAWHSSSGCQPNFVALNTGRYLYLVGWPSRWALAHNLVICVCVCLSVFVYICLFRTLPSAQTTGAASRESFVTCKCFPLPTRLIAVRTLRCLVSAVVMQSPRLFSATLAIEQVRRYCRTAS